MIEVLNDTVPAGYPGHNCPGLIEALRRLCPIPRGSPVIRGITAPASLKLENANDKSGCKASYPGHNCPGLIEASTDLHSLR
ncbi:protein of unknown function [Candidatus Methylocalor cossyra]|uniref:Uncharacterized protein n=1 Tax=Candidatus Methylocalor cossyra TaxID=3108543 RepID=A0ABM9NK79_9GAMM